ncbi:replication initiation protein [Hominenteromicrobium sp.]|jgi:hypothetical protein|uniref:replication initiation protein n=1 Tax=Hominenteromicrobium sp. TaxID=3073581 RepID=UPI003993D355
MARKKIDPIVGLGYENKLTVQKSLPLFALWRSDLTLSEFKILDTYLSRIDSHKPEKRAIILEKGEIENALGIQKINNQDLKLRLKHLMGNVVEVPDKDEKKGFQLVTLFEEAEAEQDDDGLWNVKLECTQKAMKYFFNIENLGYLRYKLRCITSLTSRYTYIMFIYLEANRFRKSWEVPLEELKKILHCENEATYNEFRFFNVKILKKVQKEMHEKTECQYSYFPIKRGRSVKAIRFEVKTLPKQYGAPEQLEMPGFTDSEPIFDVSQSEAERRDLYRDALAPYVVTDDQIDGLVQLARKHIDARGHFTGSDLDQQIYNYLLFAKRHAKTNARSEIKNIYRYLLPIIENNDIGW